jgi:hypothetical protein
VNDGRSGESDDEQDGCEEGEEHTAHDSREERGRGSGGRGESESRSESESEADRERKGCRNSPGASASRVA